MKAMIVSDLCVWRQGSAAISLLFVAIGAVCGALNQSVLMAFSMVLCMFAISSVFSGPNTDEQQDWQVGRLCLPVSRKQVVVGRYVTMAIFFALALVLGLVSMGLAIAGVQLFAPSEETSAMMADGSLASLCVLAMGFCALFVSVTSGAYFPLTFKFGVKKAVRFVPAVMVVITLLAVMVMGAASEADAWSGLPGTLESSPVAVGMLMLAVSIIISVASCLISVRLYENREF